MCKIDGSCRVASCFKFSRFHSKAFRMFMLNTMKRSAYTSLLISSFEWHSVVVRAQRTSEDPAWRTSRIRSISLAHLCEMLDQLDHPRSSMFRNRTPPSKVMPFVNSVILKDDSFLNSNTISRTRYLRLYKQYYTQFSSILYALIILIL